MKKRDAHVWYGLLFWTAVCLLFVSVRGIRWEEGYERAQVLLGITPYPGGHPHARWYWNAFSIHYYASAAVLWLTQSAAVVCGGRQFIAVLAVHLPIFGLTWLLSRRVLAAHVATLLSVVGAITVFESYMPIVPWANKATSGMIGIGWAFGVLAALCAGRGRGAGLLFGLMPLIHIGQWPMLMLTVLVWSAWQWRVGRRDAVMQFGRFAAAGLLCCAAFAAFQRPFMIAEPATGAYQGVRDGHTVWAQYVTYADMHRAPVSWPRFGPMGNSVIAMAGFLVLALPRAWRELRITESRPAAAILFVYGVFCVSAIFFAQVVHRLMGVDVPYIVAGWMPYRLTIHLAMLALCGATAWAFSGQRTGLPWVVPASLAWLALLPVWPWVLEVGWVDRYLSAPEIAVFLVAGGALPRNWAAVRRGSNFRWPWAVLAAAGLAALGWYHQMAAAAVCGGACLALAEARLRAPTGTREVWKRPFAIAIACLAATTVSAALAREWQSREHLSVTAFESEVERYLDAHSAPGDLVLTPLDERYQMVLNQPVVATFETWQHIGYMRSLAATTDKLFADLYGVRDGQWYDWELWQRRSAHEWRALGEAYGFRYVLSKNFHPLHLTERLRGDGLILYEVMPDR